MLEWLRTLLIGKRMNQKELQEAILLEEAMVGHEVFVLDSAASVQLVKEAGCPVRKFNGTRYDN